MQQALAGQRPDLLALDGIEHILALEELGHPVEGGAGMNLDHLAPAGLVDGKGFLEGIGHGGESIG